MKKIKTRILIAILIPLLLCGCSTFISTDTNSSNVNATNYEDKITNKRLITIHDEYVTHVGYMQIIVDKETMVCYLIKEQGVHGISVTPMLDKDGKPLLYKKLNKNANTQSMYIMEIKKDNVDVIKIDKNENLHTITKNKAGKLYIIKIDNDGYANISPVEDIKSNQDGDK